MVVKAVYEAARRTSGDTEKTLEILGYSRSVLTKKLAKTGVTWTKIRFDIRAEVILDKVYDGNGVKAEIARQLRAEGVSEEAIRYSTVKHVINQAGLGPVISEANGKAEAAQRKKDKALLEGLIKEYKGDFESIRASLGVSRQRLYVLLKISRLTGSVVTSRNRSIKDDFVKNVRACVDKENGATLQWREIQLARSLAEGKDYDLVGRLVKDRYSRKTYEYLLHVLAGDPDLARVVRAAVERASVECGWGAGIVDAYFKLDAKALAVMSSSVNGLLDTNIAPGELGEYAGMLKKLPVRWTKKQLEVALLFKVKDIRVKPWLLKQASPVKIADNMAVFDSFGLQEFYRRSPQVLMYAGIQAKLSLLAEHGLVDPQSLKVNIFRKKEITGQDIEKKLS